MDVSVSVKHIIQLFALLIVGETTYNEFMLTKMMSSLGLRIIN